MLTRVLEPEFMDTQEEAHDYDTMDHAEVNRRFADDFLTALCRGDANSKHLPLPRGEGRVGKDSPWRGEGASSANLPLQILDLGTGTAQIPIELCRRGQRLQILAVDAAGHMLVNARRNVAAAGFSEQIELAQTDAKRLPLGDASYDCGISNSIIHHLPEPGACLREAVRVVRPHGLLFFRDLLRPESEAELNSLVDRYAPRGLHSPAAARQRDLFAASLRAALTLAEIRNLIVPMGFSEETVEQTSDRHWTWSARKPCG
ncbi:MAG TPA: class I SAM-dependent methyltransferase [Pirellulales bacterium]|jgi:ubiquinone/menaquinone biosynthesis C-methylase UbiE